MPDPVDLPKELFDQILNDALGTSRDELWLCGALRLSRKWHEGVVPRLYSKWSYNGCRHTPIALWRYLRTILTNPQRAEMVRVLNIGNWGFSPPSYYNKNLDLSLEDLDLIRNAIHIAGIPHLESEILEGIRVSDRRPMMALLLTRLPNVSKIYAHVSPGDSILTAVLQHIIDRQASNTPHSFLQQLGELYLLGEVPPLTVVDWWYDPPLTLHDIWPVFYLPRLRTLALTNLDTGDAATLFTDRSRPCHIQHLRLATRYESTCTTPDVLALLTLPTALTSFAFYFRDWDVFREASRPPKPAKISNPDIWSGLQKHRESLVSLDIYRDGGVCKRETIGHFDRLCSYHRLKFLSVQVEVLLGGYYDGSLAPFRLKDTLPFGLESLVLAIEEGYADIPELSSSQIQEVVGGGRFPELKSLVLDHVEAKEDYYRQKDDPRLYAVVDEVCTKAGVQFEVTSNCLQEDGIRPGCPTPSGGACQWLWKETYQMRQDGDMRKRAWGAF